jgi:hypothetical protein
MRRYARRAVAALAITVALAVTGCVATPGGTKPTPSPSATPLFSSDEEALAAAEEAYAAYVSVTDAIFAEGGVGLDRLSEVATGSQLSIERTGLEEMANKGYRSTGATAFDHMEIQRYSEGLSDDAEVVVYLCQDISAVDVLDSTGRSVVTEDRPNRISYEVSFDAEDGDVLRLLVSDRVPWNGRSC